MGSLSAILGSSALRSTPCVHPLFSRVETCSLLHDPGMQGRNVGVSSCGSTVSMITMPLFALFVGPPGETTTSSMTQYLPLHVPQRRGLTDSTQLRNCNGQPPHTRQSLLD